MANPIFLMITLQSKMYQEKLLGITTDNELTFKSHLKISAKKLIKNLVHLLE